MAAITTAAITASAAAYSAYSSDKNAKEANKIAQSSGDAAIDWEMQQYEDWKSVYGDLEQNLADYYNNLSTDEYVAQNIETFQSEQDIATTNLRETLAQRGIEQSGLAGAVELAGEISSAESRAQIRVDAPREVAAQKSSFLQLGLATNPASNVSVALGNQATQDAADARTATAASGEAISSAISSGVNLIETIGADRQTSTQVGGGALIDAPTDYGTTGEVYV